MTPADKDVLWGRVRKNHGQTVQAVCENCGQPQHAGRLDLVRVLARPFICVGQPASW